MSDPIRLELSSVAEWHPAVGDLMLRLFGLAAMRRLSVHPMRLPDAVSEREVLVCHTPRGSRRTTTHRLLVGWSGVGTRDEVERANRPMDETEVTEKAAVLLSALTLAQFEGGRIIHVLQIGDGGDFQVEVDWRPEPVQLEVRGVLRDDTRTGSITRAKEREKRTQVGEGYVSVTAFHHNQTGGVYSVLCFASRPTSGRRLKGKRR